MTVWELRQAVESSIPAWVLLIPLGTVVLAWLFYVTVQRRP